MEDLKKIMHVKGKNFIKLFLFIFVIIAVYMGRKDFFNELPEKVKNVLPNSENIVEKSELQKPKSINPIKQDNPETLNFEFSAKDKNSFVGNVVLNTLNKILENPKGRNVVKGVLQKMMRQSHEIVGRDIFLSRYLAHDISLGDGRKAVCGDRVNVLYSDATEKELKKELVIGEGLIGINLENGIIGMKEGGKRNIVSPLMNTSQDVAQEDKQKTMSAIIHLLSIKSNNKTDQNLTRPFFDKVEEEYLSGIKLICGDTVQGTYVLSDLKGNILYNSEKSDKNFSFRIGENKIPIELSNALIGLPASKAVVSFIVSPSDIENSFKKIKNFIPKEVLNKKQNNPVILNFKFVLHAKG